MDTNLIMMGFAIVGAHCLIAGVGLMIIGRGLSAAEPPQPST